MVVCCLGVLVVLASYGLRTPVVLGQVVGPRISDHLEDREIELRVGSMSGVGFTGVRIYDVEFGVRRDSGAVEGAARYVDIYPDLRESLSARRPVIDTVIVSDGHVVIARGKEDETARRSGVGSKEGRSQGVERWLSEEVTLHLRGMTASMKGVNEQARIDEATMVVGPKERRLVEVKGRGEAAGVELNFERRGESIYVAIEPSALQKLLADLPVELSLEGFSVGFDEIGAITETERIDGLALRLHGLELRSRHGSALMMRASESTLKGDEIAIRWSAENARVVGDERGYDLTAVELAYRQDVSGFGFQTEVHDGEGGRVEVEGQWHLPTSLVGLNVWVHDFSWDGTMPWPTAKGSPFRRATIDGVFHGDIDLIHRLVAIDGQLGVRQLEIDLPFVASEPLFFEEVHLELPLTVDLRGGAASVVGGKIGLGELAPLGFDGRVVDAGGSYAFDLEMAGRGIDAGKLPEIMPEVLLGAVAQTRMNGHFGLQVLTSGHSAYPNSLVLEVNFDGDVKMIEDIQWDKVEALRAEEGTFFDSETHPGRAFSSGGWVDLDILPVHIPAAVLAAEDASFYEHEGLDWKGLRMAAVHNLKERALVRGGSTITQQVAKNVFLTHDRTLSRKLQEAFLTWRVESTLSKNQILELYLNVAHWGPEIYGLAGASEYYFSKNPEELSAVEAVMLASILPSPLRFGGAVQAGYLPSSREDKMRRVLVNMRFVGDLGWADYFAAEAQLDEGMIGTRSVEICADDESAPEGAVPCDELDLVAGDGEEDGVDWAEEDFTDEAGWMPLTH